MPVADSNVKSAHNTSKTPDGDYKLIYVTGDSWSAGEWDTSKGDDINFHARDHSFSRYLAETNRYKIIHCPHPGWSDLVSLDQLKVRHDLDEIDYIIFVKTCATRSFVNFKKEENEDMYANPHVFHKIYFINNYIYEQLETFKDKLILVGGIERIRPEFECFFKIPSVTELLFPDFKDSEYFGDIKYIEQFIEEDKIGVDALLSHSLGKIEFWKSKPEMFYPDGAHPNRYAHKLLAEHIDNHLRQF